MTKLVVLRGPSGSGKSSVARAIRAMQDRPVALIEQDYVRRVILSEGDVPNGLNIELIKRTVLFALDESYDVILEGIFDAGRYERMFEEIVQSHNANNYFFYFDIPLDETIRRHQFKPNKDEFGEKKLREWYKEKDFLHCVKESIITKQSALDETVEFIIDEIN